MALIVMFLLGVGNFAMHGAMRDSVLARVSWTMRQLGGHLSLGVEYLMLLACMLMTAEGSAGWVWGYGLYTLANAVAAWFVLSRRI